MREWGRGPRCRYSISVFATTHTPSTHSAGQKFFRSIQSAIFLFSAVTLISGAGVGMALPAGGAGQTRAGGGARVIPVINTNHTATIAAELRSGEM